MRHFHPISTAALGLLFLLVLAGCDSGAPPAASPAGEWTPPAPPESGHALVLNVDEEGALIDAVRVEPGSGIERIEFTAPESGETIYGFAVGPNLHGAIPEGALASSRQAEGYLGVVTVDIDNDWVVGLAGNGMSSAGNLEKTYADAIAEARAAEDLPRAASTTVVGQDRFRKELVSDAEGNERPPEPTAY